MAPCGAELPPGLPDMGYLVNRKSEVWSDNVLGLYEQCRRIILDRTNDLERRLAEHRIVPSGFTGRYAVAKLVHFEWTASVREAIVREKRIKGWTRAKKVALIETANPYWHDLSARR